MAINTTTLEGILAASQAKTPATSIKTMSQAEIDAATAKTVAAGGKSTDAANRLPGESASAANARITAGYKEMLAQPILTPEAKAAGAAVEYVRTGAGGVGSYTVTTPVGYTGPKITTTDWTAGIIPSNSPYTTGTTLGVQSTGKGTYTTVGGATPTVTPGATKPGTTTPGGTTPGGTTPAPGGTTPTAPVGTPPAYVYNSATGKWEMPAKPTETGSWVWDNVKGWTNTTVNPGATGTTTEGGPTLAKDTFKNTLALFFGAEIGRAHV